MQRSRLLYLVVMLACLLEGCKPENITIPLNADKANPGGSNKPSPPPVASPASEASEVDPPYAQDNRLTPPSTPKPASTLAPSMPGASTPRRGIALPPTPDEEEHEELEIKAGEDALLAAQRDLTKIQHHYEAAKKANPEHQLSAKQISVLQKHRTALASDLPGHSQAIRDRITQFLEQGAPKATSDAERPNQDQQAKALAQDLLSDKAQERAKAIDFLKQHKYEPQYQATLSCLAAQVWQTQGLLGIQKLLRAVDESGRESIGLQHLLLQLSCINACLGIGSPQLHKTDFEHLDAEFHLLEPFNAWLEQGLKEVAEGQQGLHQELIAAFSRLGPVLAWSQASTLYTQGLKEKKNEQVRRSAADALIALAQAAPELALQPLLAAIKDEKWNVRSTAAAALGKVAQADPKLAQHLLPTLLVAIKDEDIVVRRSVAVALGALAQADTALAPQIIQPLGEILRGEHSNFRCEAVYALGEVAKAAPEMAIALLLEAMSDNDESVRKSAVIAFREVGQVAPALAIAPLLEAMKDKDWKVRRSAAAALSEVAKTGPTLAIEPLLKDLKDSKPDVRQAAAGALGEAAKADPALAAQLLAPLLEALSDDNEEVRSTVAEALGKVAQAAPDLAPQILSPLLKACKEEDPWVRSAVVEAVGQVVQAAPELARQAIASLQEALRDGQREDVRSAAAEVLGHVAQSAPGLASQTLAPLKEALMDDQHKDVRSAAAQALGKVAQATPELTPQTLPLLLAASKEKEASVRSAAAEALNGYSTQQLIHHYLNTPALEALKPILLTRLYSEALIMEQDPWAQQQQLTLYSRTGQSVVWKLPKTQAEQLQVLLDSAPSQHITQHEAAQISSVGMEATVVTGKLKEQYKDTCSHMGALFGNDPLPITEAHFHLEVLEEVEEREAKEELEKKEAQDQMAAQQARSSASKNPLP